MDLLAAIDPAELVDALRVLIAIPSVTGSAAESEAQQHYTTLLAGAGLEVDHWRLDLPALRADPDHPGEEAARSEGWGVVGVLPGTDGTDGAAGGAALVLQGHIDVVPPGDPAAWPASGPYGADADARTVYGRGACDMKAGLVANLGVVLALRRSGLRLRRPLALHSVVGEEDGGLGALATLRRGHTGEACVISEPTSGTVITANAGALTFRLEVPGKAAHGSVRHEGVSALEAFGPVQRALAELERERNVVPEPLFAGRPVPYPLSIGTVRAGDWASTVPDLLVAEGRYGVRLGEDLDSARAELSDRLAEVCAADPWLRDHPVRLTWPGGQFASGRLADDHPLLGEVQAAVAEVTGVPPARRAAPYGSDLRLYAGIGGIPTLHYGPGDVRHAHAPDEQVPIAELVDCCRALALLTARRCGLT
jgi:acetylornithine deacetylase